MHLPIQLVMIVDPEAWAEVSDCEPDRAAGNIGQYLEQQVAGLAYVRESGAQVLVKVAEIATPPTHKAQTRIDGGSQ